MIPAGFKPTTFWSVVRCSIQLSYGTSLGSSSCPTCAKRSGRFLICGCKGTEFFANHQIFCRLFSKKSALKGCFYQKTRQSGQSTRYFRGLVRGYRVHHADIVLLTAYNRNRRETLLFPSYSLYIQLVTPSDVISAVSTVTAICITVFQNSLFFILSSFIFNHEWHEFYELLY